MPWHWHWSLSCTLIIFDHPEHFFDLQIETLPLCFGCCALRTALRRIQNLAPGFSCPNWRSLRACRSSTMDFAEKKMWKNDERLWKMMKELMKELREFFFWQRLLENSLSKRLEWTPQGGCQMEHLTKGRDLGEWKSLCWSFSAYAKRPNLILLVILRCLFEHIPFQTKVPPDAPRTSLLPSASGSGPDALQHGQTTADSSDPTWISSKISKMTSGYIWRKGPNHSGLPAELLLAWGNRQREAWEGSNVLRI